MWYHKLVAFVRSQKQGSAREWPLWRKWVTVVIVASLAFLCTFAAAVIAPARDRLQDDFKVSTTMIILPFSMYNLGLALGSIITSTLSETLGRVGVYAVCMPALMLFSLATGFSTNIASIVVCRFFAGFFASPGITIASAVIADMFAPAQRGLPMFCYYSMPWSGSVVGPLIGYLVIAHKDWQWTQWVFLIIATPFVLFALVFLEETYATKTEVQEPPRADDSTFMQKCADRCNAIIHGIPTFVRKQIFRPVEMLATEMIVTLTCLYAGFNFGLVYSLIIASPDVFAQTYGFDYTAQGLSFSGLIVGCILGSGLLLLDDKLFFQKQKSMVPQWLGSSRRSSASDDTVVNAPSTEKEISPSPSSAPSNTSSTRTSMAEGTEGAIEKGLPQISKPTAASSPEARLHGAMVGGTVLPIGLIWFAWTARPSIHWICPIISQTLITCGAMMVYVSLSAYLVDTYGPRYSASAQAANAITRYVFAAVIPLFITPMYNALGTGWATSILALCALLMSPIPFVFFATGERLRNRCHFRRESI